MGKRRSGFGENTLLSAFGILVVVVLFSAGMFAALARKLMDRMEMPPARRKTAGAV